MFKTYEELKEAAKFADQDKYFRVTLDVNKGFRVFYDVFEIPFPDISHVVIPETFSKLMISRRFLGTAEFAGIEQDLGKYLSVDMNGTRVKDREFYAYNLNLAEVEDGEDEHNEIMTLGLLVDAEFLDRNGAEPLGQWMQEQLMRYEGVYGDVPVGWKVYDTPIEKKVITIKGGNMPDVSMALHMGSRRHDKI